MFYLCQECTRVAKERITQSLQQVQTTIERSKVEEMFRESSQQLKALEVCEGVNAWVYNAISIISLLFFAWQTFHWTDMQKVIFALVGWYNQLFGLIIICFGKLVFTLRAGSTSLLSWEKQFCFLSLIWFFRCKHPFIDEIDSSILACNTKHMAVRPGFENIWHMLNKDSYLINWFIQSLS